MTPEMKAKIEAEIAKAPLVMFIKGNRDFPMCGFSARVIQVANALGCEYNDVNLMEDFDMMAAMVEFADWPTTPLIYVNGEFIGGCDITLEMFESGELQEMLNTAAA